MAELRWRMFSKQQCDAKKLPPTWEAYRQKVFCAHYTALQWKSSHLPSPALPDPEDYGWKWDSSNLLYEAVMTTIPSAPESIIHLTVCQCKTNCSNNRCKCRKIRLKCSEMCQCQDCENNEDDDIIDLDECDVDEEDDYWEPYTKYYLPYLLAYLLTRQITCFCTKVILALYNLSLSINKLMLPWLFESNYLFVSTNLQKLIFACRSVLLTEAFSGLYFITPTMYTKQYRQ